MSERDKVNQIAGNELSDPQTECDVLDIVINNTDAHLAFIDKHFNFIMVNSAFEKSSGFSREQLIGSNYFDLFPNKENHKIFESVRDNGLAIEFHAKPFEFGIEQQSKRTYWDWSLKPVNNAHGQLIGLVLSLKDVTERQGLIRFSVKSALRLFFITVGVIFVAEILVMMLLTLLPQYPHSIIALVDSLILSFILFPLLYLLLLRPLISNLSEQALANDTLHKAFAKLEDEKLKAMQNLENRIQQRTKELIKANESLKAEIVERLKIENELENERHRFFSILNELPASVHLLRPDHSIFYANRYFRNEFGDINQETCYKLLQGRDVPCSVCNAFDVLETNQQGVREVLRSNGKIYNVYNYPFSDTDGKRYVLQLGIDITERKKTEEALQKSDQRFRSLIKSMEDTVFTLDRKKRILEIYGNLFERLGINVKNTINRKIDHVFGRKSQPVHEKAITKSFKGKNIIYEWEIELNDQTRYIQNSLSPIINEKGNTVGLVGVARDNTEQKNLERRLIHAERLMTMAEMSAMISHEFRNALTSVRMILELQTESASLSPSEKKSLGVALSSITHMEEIVQQLLNFSRPGPIILNPANVNAVLEESMEFSRLQLKKYNIVVKADLDPDLPEIDLDQKQFKEAVINLILNAITAISLKGKKTRKKEISITTKKHTLNKTLRDFAPKEINVLKRNGLTNDHNSEIVLHKGQPCIMIQVVDTGIGIKRENLEQIFQPFFTTMSQGGSGLGLSMVKRTVNNHEGIIVVKSKPEKGTVFSIFLPLNKKKGV